MRRSRTELKLLALVASLLFASCALFTNADRHGSDCAGWVRDRLGHGWSWAGFWDYEYLRSDGLLVGDDSDIGAADLPGVPVSATRCVVQINRELVALLDSPDVVLEPMEGTEYERSGSEVGTRLDFTGEPSRSEPYANTEEALDILIDEGSYAAMINPGGAVLRFDGLPVVGAGIALSDESSFDLVVVRVDDGAPITDELAIEALRRSAFLDDLDVSQIEVRRGDGFVILRFPWTADPSSWPGMWWVTVGLAEATSG